MEAARRPPVALACRVDNPLGRTVTPASCGEPIICDASKAMLSSAQDELPATSDPLADDTDRNQLPWRSPRPEIRIGARSDVIGTRTRFGTVLTATSRDERA